MKWVALGLILLGLALMALAVKLDQTDTFDAVVTGYAGAGCFAVGVIWVVFLLFLTR